MSDPVTSVEQAFNKLRDRIAAEVACANPVGLPPGSISEEELAIIEDTMNATIRECVFVTEHIDAGGIDTAMEALLQIKLNAETTAERLEAAVAKAGGKS